MINLSRAERITDPSSLRDIPGPGYYSSKISNNKPSYIFGRSERAVSDLSNTHFEDIPGPGAYASISITSSSTHRNPFNSSSNRFQTYECNWKPGPGHYHTSTIHSEKKPQKLVQTLCIHPSPVPASIPLLERHELAIYDGEQNKVSPAEYNPKYEKTKPRKPASLFSKSKIQRAFHRPQGSENLGPGCYNLENTENFPQVKTISLTERFKQTKSLSPGPGTYNPNISATKGVTGCYVSKVDRNFNLAKKIIQEVPVKRRKVNERVNPNAVFVSGSERDCNKIPASSPVGPGKYEWVSEKKKKDGFMFAQEPRFRNKEDSPVGPGSYDPTDMSKRSSPANFKTARFKELSDLYVHSIGEKNIPGPGNYELMDKNFKHRGVSFDSYASRQQIHKHEQSPDPGQYYTDSYQSSGVRIGVDQRFKPGPNSYIQSKASGEFVGPGSYKSKNTLVKRTFNISWI